MGIFDTIRENVTAKQVAEYYGLKVNRNGMACCPFHNDKHPSMKVDKRFFCFGCGAKGDAIDFVANYYGIGLKAATEKIASDFALAYDNNSYSEGYHRKSIPKKTEYQIWVEQKRELFGKLSRLHEKLRQLQMKYEPKTREDSDWSPLFALACFLQALFGESCKTFLENVASPFWRKLQRAGQPFLRLTSDPL